MQELSNTIFLSLTSGLGLSFLSQKLCRDFLALGRVISGDWQVEQQHLIPENELRKANIAATIGFFTGMLVPWIPTLLSLSKATK